MARRSAPQLISRIAASAGEAALSDICAPAIAAVEAHRAMADLRRFGTTLRSRPLPRAALAVFFASTAAFFREVPGGILALALRVTDDWMECERFGAVERGAAIL